MTACTYKNKTINIYRAPQSSLQTTPKITTPKFYVVSTLKLTLLLLGTLGLYRFYWTYKNWSLYKTSSNEKLMPLIRTLFSIFFMHQLFNNINDTLKEEKIPYHWSPNIMATLFIILIIASRTLYLPETITIGIFICIVYCMVNIQNVVNISQGDEEGKSNNEFTFYNIFWITSGPLLLLTLWYVLPHSA